MLELSLISQICKRILKNCYCPILEDDLNDVILKLEVYFNNLNYESTDSSEVTKI